ncbi:coiled-coil domain-containing protein 80 isoform X2 [Amblyraja radiata]|uniref:coiled-coil domain-containing protein 80 isoform X2 n=1 Tax=Amblyraja radiata TaxID=386614 RepID=UPI0014033EDB|nr:coiled-coil domain-containing protein 80 isoform X2 [Amblyraja radiata]
MRTSGLRPLAPLLLFWLLSTAVQGTVRRRLLRPGSRTSQPGGIATTTGRRATVQRDEGRSQLGRTRGSGIPLRSSRPGMVRGRRGGARSRMARVSASATPSLLSGMVGRQRLWVISAPHPSDGYYRLMLSLLKEDVYCELAERHIAQLVLFHQEGEVAGKLRKITSEGEILEESLDAKTVLKLMDFLKMERGKFSMALLKKNLQLEETYPYPVRLEAMYELIDQDPIRKIERLRQKGFVQKCKDARVEGQVAVAEGGEKKKPTVRKPFRISLNTHGGSKLVRTTSAPRVSTTSSSTTITITTRPTTTSTTTDVPATAATERPRSHKVIFTPPRYHKPETPLRPTSAANSHNAGTKSPQEPTLATATSRPRYPRVQAGRQRYGKADKKEGSYRQKGLPVTPGQRQPTKAKSPKSKTTNNKILTNEYVDKYQPEKTSSPNTGQVVPRPPKSGKVQKKPIKAEKARKQVKNKKTGTKVKPLTKTKPAKKIAQNNKPKKTVKKGGFKQTKKIPGRTKSLASVLSYYENRRRLLLISSPNDQSNMYEQQRDEYLEHVCEMALRKITIITLFGPMINSTIKIDHYQLDNEKPVKDIRYNNLDQHLITELRKEYGLSENEFFMVLTDLDMKVKQFYEVPIAMQAIFDLIETFTTRIKEMEKQKKDGTQCKKEDKPRSLESFLSRFRWRRRLFIISTPSDEEWAYQHQLYALNSQACNLGLRHLAVLKMMGVGIDVGGVLELFPINGTASVDREELSQSLVKDIRDYFQVSAEYFSMLLVGKDGNVKSWYPTPMWNMAIVYDLVDSMQLRRQEMSIQQSLGMRCPEDEYGYSYHGYQDGYHQQGHYGGYPY